VIKRVAAVVSALVSIGIALVVGVPMASANEGAGGQCNNYGDHNIIVAPFCGASLPTPTSNPMSPVQTSTVPHPVSTLPTSLPPIRTVTPSPFPTGVLCPQIYPPLPGCPGYTPPIPIGPAGQ
jgi:hypothetical protein